MRSLIAAISVTVFWPFVALAATADKAEPAKTLVTPLTFVKEYIREIGELNKITTEMHEKAPKKEPELFSHFVYYSEKIQQALGTDINLLAEMRLRGEQDDLPFQLAKLYLIKGETQSELSTISSEMIVPHEPNKELIEQVKRMPKLRAKNDMVDETIAKTMTPLVFFTLVDPNGDGQGHTSKLLITTAERDDLLRQLRVEFGTKLDDKAGQVLYDAIKTHKGSDEFLPTTDKR